MAIGDQKDICNRALNMIGAQGMSNMNTDNTAEARWCRANYEETRDALISEHGWRWAEQQAILTDPVTSPWEDGYLYALPDNQLHIFRIYLDSSMNNQADWRRMGNAIWSRTGGTLYALIMVTDADIEQVMPKSFMRALEARLAREMVVPITRSTKMFELINISYADKLEKALSTDSSEGRSEAIASSRLALSRYGGWR